MKRITYTTILFFIFFLSIDTLSATIIFPNDTLSVNFIVSQSINFTGVLEVRGTLDIESDADISSHPITAVVVDGGFDKGVLRWTGDGDLKLPDGVTITFINGGTIETSSCDAEQTISFPSDPVKFAYASCDGEDASLSFDELVNGIDPASLPVELVDFRGAEKGGTVQLEWETASEIDNDYFEVLHSIDGKEFSVIDKITGAGTTNQFQYYSFVHAYPTAGVNYYRLKQIDYDGTFAYSPVIAIQLNGGIAGKVKLFPNPAHTYVQLSVPVEATINSVELLDASGKVIPVQVEVEGTIRRIAWEERLATGLYFVRVVTPQEVQTSSLVIR